MLIATISLQAQHKDLKKLFNKCENQSGFTLKVFDPDIDIESSVMNTFSNFINDAEHVYVLKFDSDLGNKSDYQNMNVKLKKIINKYEFESMMEISDEDDNVSIYLCKGKNEKVSDFILIKKDKNEGAVVWASTK